MLDIDRFKRLNDVHGHQVGDEVLREIAAALSGACRTYETVARYGGEEFAVILPACAEVESLRLAERLREAVASAETEVAVTASVGVATFPAHATHARGLVKAADQALYVAKRAGRNRVSQADEYSVLEGVTAVQG
jgi:diguanylate cyclase